MFAALSDQTIQELLGLISAIFTPIIAYFMLRIKQQQTVSVQQGAVSAANTELVAKKLDQVDAFKSEKMDSIAKVASATHSLVNSNSGVQLKLYASMARRLYNITKDNADLEVAKAAEAASRQHEEAQDKVDADNPPGLPISANTVTSTP